MPEVMLPEMQLSGGAGTPSDRLEIAREVRSNYNFTLNKE
jgi:hypothetical protein